MITNQEAFDKVVRHLRNQVVRAVIEGSCRYRLGALKCAIGCLIPDEAYSAQMESLTVYPLLDRFQNLKQYLPVGVGFSSELQWLHDKNGSEDQLIDWEGRFTAFATRHNLTIPEKNNVCDTPTIRAN